MVNDLNGVGLRISASGEKPAEAAGPLLANILDQAKGQGRAGRRLAASWQHVRVCAPDNDLTDRKRTSFIRSQFEDDADNRRWAERKLDPECFDLEAANRAITRVLRLSRDDYRARRL